MIKELIMVVTGLIIYMGLGLIIFNFYCNWYKTDIDEKITFAVVWPLILIPTIFLKFPYMGWQWLKVKIKGGNEA